MNPPAARFLALADTGCSAWWRYVLGVCGVTACWLIGGGQVYALLLQAPLGAATGFIAINASILVLLAAVVAAAVLVHRRPWRTLITPLPRIAWRRMAEGGALWGALLLLSAVIESLLFPGRYSWTFDAQRWLPFVLAAVLLTPLQCAAEELMFRGYLMQALGRLWRQPAFVALASSLLFALPHFYNPEVAAYGLWIMAANYLAMALFLASITLRDGRLELAIGAHAANNLLLALGVNYADSVFDTPSLFTANTLDPVYSLLTLLASAVVFHWWMFRKRQAHD